ILHAEPDLPASPMRRSSTALFAGVMIAVLLVAGFTVLGLLLPSGSTAWQQPGAIIVEKETGNRFVFLAGALHPTLNNTSAKLIPGTNGHVVSVSQNSLRGVPHGAPVGIPGAPDSLPAPDDLSGNQWLVCAPTTTDAAGGQQTSLSVLIGGNTP